MKQRKVNRFSKVEDDTIKNFVLQHGEIRGIFLASCFLNRSKSSVQNRYADFICRKEFSQEETRQIILMHDAGMKYSKMKAYFPGRTSKMLQVEYKAAKKRKEKLRDKENIFSLYDVSSKAFSDEKTAEYNISGVNCEEECLKTFLNFDDIPIPNSDDMFLFDV